MSIKLDKKLPNLATSPQQLAHILLSTAVKSLSKLHGYISRKNVYEFRQKLPNLATGPQQLACILLSAAVKSLGKLHGYISRRKCL